MTRTWALIGRSQSRSFPLGIALGLGCARRTIISNLQRAPRGAQRAQPGDGAKASQSSQLPVGSRQQVVRTGRVRNMIANFKDLIVYKKAFEHAMKIFHLTKAFPKEEQYSLTDQVRRSSRSICANIERRGEKDVIRPIS